MTWPTKKLGEISRVFSGSSAPQDEKYFKNGKFPFVRVFDLATSRSGAELVETRDYVNELAITELNLVNAQKGAIVFPKSGASILNNNRAMLGANAYIVSHLAAVEVNENMALKNWIYYFLDKFDMGRLVSDPGYPSLNISAVEKIKIPLPPLTTQRQIVKRLDKIAEAQKLNDNLIQKTDELFQSLLHSLIRANSGINNWPTKKLGDIVDVQSGSGFPMAIQGKTDGVLPFYKVSDMNLIGNEIEMIFHNNSITKSQRESLKYKLAPAGTIIFPKIGAAVATNKKRILSRSALYDNNVMGLIPSSGVLSKYLYFWLITFNISLWASESMPPSIKKSTVEKFEIPLSPLKIQQQIVAKLSAVQDYKKQLLEQKSKLKELFDSALAKSFNGKA